MAVEHLSASAPPEKAAEILDRDACCVIDDVAPPELSRTRSGFGEVGDLERAQEKLRREARS